MRGEGRAALDRALERGISEVNIDLAWCCVLEYSSQRCSPRRSRLRTWLFSDDVVPRYHGPNRRHRKTSREGTFSILDSCLRSSAFSRILTSTLGPRGSHVGYYGERRFLLLQSIQSAVQSSDCAIQNHCQRSCQRHARWSLNLSIKALCNSSYKSGQGSLCAYKG